MLSPTKGGVVNVQRKWKVAADIGQHLHCVFVYIHSPRLLIPFFCKPGFIISFLFGIVRELIKCESLAFTFILVFWFAFWVRIVLWGLYAKECGWMKVKWGLRRTQIYVYFTDVHVFLYRFEFSMSKNYLFYWSFEFESTLE